MDLNPFHATSLFLYAMETSEYLWFSMFSRDIEKEQWHEIGWKR